MCYEIKEKNKISLYTSWVFVVMYGHFFFFQAEDGIRDYKVTGVQTCALPISFFFHVPEEKCQQQRADVRAVHVRIGHQNNFMIAQLAGVKIVFADAGTQRGEDRKSVV